MHEPVTSYLYGWFMSGQLGLQPFMFLPKILDAGQLSAIVI